MAGRLLLRGAQRSQMEFTGERLTLPGTGLAPSLRSCRRAIARRLCAEGCEVLLSSRKQANVDRAVRQY